MRPFFALLLLAGCAHRGVVAEGRGADARAALLDAQRRAVEVSAGLSLSARTRVEKGLSEGAVESRTRGVVASYVVLEESSGPDGHRARIRAVVGPAPPRSPSVQGDGPAAGGARRALGTGDGPVVVTVAAQAARPLRETPHPDLRSARAVVTLRARRDGELVAEATRMASALEADTELAREAALERAGYEAALALAAALNP